MTMSLVFVAIKMNFFLLIFFQLLIGNFSEPTGKKGSVLPLERAEIRPQNGLKRNTEYHQMHSFFSSIFRRKTLQM